jgi:copper chaperone NosL
MTLLRLFSALLLISTLAACGGEEELAAKPLPQEPEAEATGHFCGMNLNDHEGPKGQIHLTGVPFPVWFTSVRDTIAFTMLPEESKAIAAIYVHDMGRAVDWGQPGAGLWIDAVDAYYVIGSNKAGGMGAAEAVPFGDIASAETFQNQHGGRVVSFKGMPRDYILGDASGSPAVADKGGKGGNHATD